MATKERAFFDILYFNKDYYFDNPDSLDFDKIFHLLPLYKNKRMEKVVQNHYKEMKENQ